MSKLQNVNNTMTSDIHSKTTREITSRQLSANSGAQSLMAVSMAWMDSLYDHDQHMLRHPDQPKQHMVRESLWYALGLVFESLQTGERDARIKRVVEIVSNVLAVSTTRLAKFGMAHLNVHRRNLTRPMAPLYGKTTILTGGNLLALSCCCCED